MRAFALTEVGSPERIAACELDVPRPADDEVLIRVATVAVNRQDVNLIVGRIPHSQLVFPHVLGLDPAGVVVASGAHVRSVDVGDRVVVRPPITCGDCDPCRVGEDDACEHIRSVGIHRPGGMAEFVAVPERNVTRIPDGLTDAEATASAHSFPVALTLLRKVQVQRGDVVLVSGAAGAVGSAAAQLATSLGASVVAAVGDEQGATWLRALPSAVAPEMVLDYGRDPAFAQSVRARFASGVDVYVETASDPAIWAEALRTMARRGRIAVIGSHAGPTVELNTNWLFRERISILGCSGSTNASFHESLALAGEGRIVPNIDSVMPWGDVTAAYRRLMNRENHGKIVLRVAPDAT
jgi:NADPH:quinone reductase-like Zn-dependent oxidoreductase